MPIELWHLGRHEMDARMQNLVKPLGVSCVDAREVASSTQPEFSTAGN